MSGDHQPLLENAFSRTRTHIPFLHQKENALNIDEKYVFFVIARSCRRYALYFVMAAFDCRLL